MNYQLGGADEEPVSNKLNRPEDAATHYPMTYEDAGADSIGELGKSAIKPPFSNPGTREYQMAGADTVEEIGGNKRDSWPWETQAGNLTKPL
jgi:hypothetical protein